MTPAELHLYLDECRELVTAEIRRIIPADPRRGAALYDLMLDYPLREAKGLRPALCIAACRALGGKLEAVLRSAAVLELYHNAFLIHDDIEDESLLRRGGPTLHRAYGVPVAVNVGDAMLALSLQPLLDNIETLGLGPALRILQAVARMTRESVEGQALELDWVRRAAWDLADEDYVTMVEQKTCWYSFITPVAIGAIAARLDPGRIEALSSFARRLGVAFQIQDDILNLAGDVGEYGKEIGGDLWEGKRTLILLHALRHAAAEDRAEALRILALPRHGSAAEAGARVKTPDEVRFLRALIDRTGSIDHARAVAGAWAGEAQRAFDGCAAWLLPGVHRDLLQSLIQYVLERVR
ncbi:polyprenyl synthetase family protein [Sorangium sp. So ce861]|uniref:polyprenyl synthetase family protein n=1 Tax=Sorangium sp. So ce861 TaxID=3133323 RepID=UPI003F5D89F0